MKTTCELSFEVLTALGCEVELIAKNNSKQLLYSITQVAEILAVPAHVIRYWEKHFPELKPERGSSSNWRNYVEQDIAILARIKKLVIDQGMTISGAKRMMANPKVDVLCSLEALLVELEDTV